MPIKRFCNPLSVVNPDDKNVPVQCVIWLHTVPIFMQMVPGKYLMNAGGRTWRKQAGGAGVDDVSFRYSSQLKASKEKYKNDYIKTLEQYTAIFTISVNEFWERVVEWIVI